MADRGRRFWILFLTAVLVLLGALADYQIFRPQRAIQQAFDQQRTREAMPTRIPPSRTPTPVPPRAAPTGTPTGVGSPTQQLSPTGTVAALTGAGTPAGAGSPSPTLEPSLTPTPSLTPSPSPQPTPTIQGPPGTRLVFDEPFREGPLDPEIWSPRLKWGTTNPPELQEYVPEAVKVQSGMLTITADRRTGGKTAYTSGAIATYDRFYFQYGYVEVRARVPRGKGLWPAVWLLSQGDSAEEIDILEVLGGDPRTVHTTIHYQQLDGKKVVKGNETRGPDYSEDFHVYAVDWQPDKLIWFIDGREVFRTIDHVSREPMYLILNLAVGGAWPGYPDATTPFPASFVIDYVRVFTRDAN